MPLSLPDRRAFGNALRYGMVWIHRHVLRGCLLAACLLMGMAHVAAAAPNRYGQAEPICLFSGSYPDPSIVRVGDDYYMTHSTAAGYAPSLLIWHSRDLLEWTPLGYALPDRRSGYAPELAYVDDTYFIYHEQVDVLTAKAPAGPWQDHGHIPGSRGIDPGLLVDTRGQRHLYTCMGLYSRLADDGLTLTSKPRQVYRGWPIPRDWAITALHLESPKLFRKNDWYYMVSAQGGTFGPTRGHMAVVARSRQPEGPWTHSPHNPIIRTWNREDPWWTTGHATLFEGPGGHWFAVYHGYRNGYRTLGRSTLMLPVQWNEDGWPVIAPQWPTGYDADRVKLNLPLHDEFETDTLALPWQCMTELDRSRCTLHDGVLTLRGDAADIATCRPLTVIARDTAYEIETEVTLNDATSAGLILFYNPQAYVSVGLNANGKITRGYRAPEGRKPWMSQSPHHGARTVRLRIINDKNDVRCYYRNAQGHWKILQSSVDISFMSDNGLLQNSSVRPGLYVTGPGTATFTTFHYRRYENRHFELHSGR